MEIEARKEPCTYCPYRTDCPSGVWSEDEYDKLDKYDAETHEQPFEWFACHATPDHACHGWAAMDNMAEDTHLLIAMRIFHIEPIDTGSVPLFTSHGEAASHGRRNIESPSYEARRAAAAMLRKFPRLEVDGE